MRVIVFGASGMLGHKLVQCLSKKYSVVGTLRSATSLETLSKIAPQAEFVSSIHAEKPEQLDQLIKEKNADVLINAIGIVKQLKAAKDPVPSITINALLPHQLANMAKDNGARLIHVSTDCVFSGSKGQYLESDAPDAGDLYGRSKLLGEVTEQAHALTLRTSIIGHELAGCHGLVDWFLSQSQTVNGFSKAVFSGLTTLELATLIPTILEDHKELSGLFHLAVEPIDKLRLLNLVKDQYNRSVEIVPKAEPVIDRSLNASRFYNQTQYQVPSWPELIKSMHDDYKELRDFYV